MKFRLITFSLITTLSIVLSACGHPESESKKIKVGAIAGPESALIEVASQVAKERYNLKVTVVDFSDYNLPNEALNDKSIDANVFQHPPYLSAQIKQHGYKFAIIGKGFVYPIGVYASKLKNLQDIAAGGSIAIPNDPSNEARSLLLLEKAGLIGLRPDAKTDATVRDIVSNPKNIKIVELEAALLPRALTDVDAAVINNTFAVTAGLQLKDAIYKEGKDSPYVNVIVAREADSNKPELQQFVSAFQSQAVIDKANQLFADGAVPAFAPSAAEK